jgi:sterol 14-demethylase
MPCRSRFVYQMFQEVIDERTEKQKTDENYEPPQDFLQVLMGAKYRDGATSTTTEITGIMIGVLLGGQHTSNVTGTWPMSHLLKDEKWLGEVMDEQKKLCFPKERGGLRVHIGL